MHSGRIDNSERHQRVLRVLMAADHPLSGEEISARIYTEIGRIPQAVSTTIGEMRSADNVSAGYVLSMSTCWRAARPGETEGLRQNKDGSLTFILPAASEPWHDGRPRYWLQTAPGWAPRWIINSNGQLIHHGATEPQRKAEDMPLQEEQKHCKNPACHKPIAHGHTCDEACNAAWKDSIFKKPEGALL